LSRGIWVVDTVSNVQILHCNFDNFGTGIGDTLTDFVISDCRFTNVHEFAIAIGDGSARGVIQNCNIQDNFDVTSAPTGITSIGSHIVIANNIINNLDGVRALSLNGASAGDSWSIYGNLIEGCTTTTYAFDTGSSGSLDYSVSGNIVRNNIGLTFRGRAGGMIANNYFEEVGGSTRTSWVLDSCEVIGNTFVSKTTVDGVLSLSSGVFSGNEVLIGSMTVSASGGAGTEITSNHMTFSDTTQTDSLTISNATSTVTLSNNHIGVGATSSGVLLSQGNIVMTGNVVSDLGGAQTRAITIDALSSTEYAIVNDNLIDNGATYGIFIDSDNVTAEGNSLSGTLGAGGGDIVVNSGHINIIVTGNSANSSGGDSRRVFHVDASPTDAFIAMNKGAIERRSTSPYAAHKEGQWTTTLNGISNDGYAGTQQLLVPVNNLPVGANLGSVDVHISNSGTTGAATVTMYRRGSGSLTATAISATSNVPAGAFSTFNVVPTTTEIIQNALEYFVLIDIPSGLAANTIVVGQVVANIVV
jgi:hypothetical protein